MVGRLLRRALLLATLVACGSAPAPPHVRLPDAVTARAAPASSLAFAPWDGIYVSKQREDAFLWVRTRASGISAWAGANLSFATTTRTPEGGWQFQITDGSDHGTLTLAPPASDGAAWRATLQPTGITYEQRVEPLEARVRAQLAVGARFVRVKDEALDDGGSLDATTRDVITILPRGRTRAELPDSPRSASCFVDALGPVMEGHGQTRAMPLPEEGSLGVVYANLNELGRGCSEQDGDPEVSGVDGSLFFFAYRDGRTVAVMLIGYMDAKIFLAPRTTRADVDALKRAVDGAFESR